MSVAANPRIDTVRAALQAGETRHALALADEVFRSDGLAPCDRAAVLALRSRVHEALGNLPAAIIDMEATVALGESAGSPAERARHWNDLGLLCADAGEHLRAIAAFQKAVTLDSGYARAFNNLGHALRGANRVAEAMDAFARAVIADNRYALAWANLGALKFDTGDEAGAEAALRNALALDPNQRGAVMALAGIERGRSRLDAAADLYGRAAHMDPRDANAPFQLAGTLAERDDLSAAKQAYAAAEARDPKMLRALFGRCLTLPMLPVNVAEIQTARARYAAGLAILERELPRRSAESLPARVLDELRWSNFLLAYHGDDDRALQLRYGKLIGDLIEARAPQWRQPVSKKTRRDVRIRVGFLSAFFRDGTVGRYFESWITDLPRDRFEVILYFLRPAGDALTARLCARADKVRACPRFRPSQLAPIVHADDLDLLVFPELGMDATTFALAALRLARVQCGAWGHPVTTGHATVDVFLASGVMEPENAAGHYTERLIVLPGIGTRYTLPDIPRDAARAHFGLPEGVPLFLCPQSLFKIHPDNDALFGRVLGAVPNGRLVAFEGRDPALTARFRTRLDVVQSDAGRAQKPRLQLLPQCSHADYLRINTVCDAMLDTLHWSGGNTSLDALACGLPIVTLPGRFMRGRQSAGMLRLMEIDETIAHDADDYVRIAARLGHDITWREGLRSRILAARGRVFDDPAPINALAAAFIELARSG
ncbi:MAG: tetratricopeptide repeat protein [Casimicrobiaceae bacterium]